MLKRYKTPGAALLVGKLVHDMKKMKAELKEHRYCLERNIEQRTGYLLKRIALLESCNTTLCEKLALARREPASPKLSTDNAAKLYVMDKLMVANVPDMWREHATAA